MSPNEVIGPVYTGPVTRLVPLTDEDVAKAALWEAAIKQNLSRNPNYTGLARERRFFTGYCGELSFEGLLIKDGIAYEYNVSTSGKRNERSEFVVYRHGRPFTLEVKTASQWQYENFMFPAKQDWQRSDLYVGVKLLPLQRGQVMGYLSARYVKILPEDTFPPNTVPTRYCPFNQMKPIDDLLAQLDSKKNSC